MQQQAKAKAWEIEQKQKLQAAPVITVGCFFENSPSSAMTGDVRLLYEFRVCDFFYRDLTKNLKYFMTTLKQKISKAIYLLGFKLAFKKILFGYLY